jgi:hypothetical protein
VGRSARRTLQLLVGVALVYTFHRALVLRVEYFDGYEYLANARALLGDRLFGYQWIRPPFVPLVQLPAMALSRASQPAAAVRIVAPHVTAALVSLVSALAVFWLFERVFARDFAILGTLLFVGGRYFIRYGAHAMADIPSAGWAAAIVAAYLGARSRRSLGAYALCGAALGAGVLTKFPLAMLGLVLLAAEVSSALRARRFEARLWLGLVIAATVSVVGFLSVMVVLWLVISGPGTLEFLPNSLLMLGRMGPTLGRQAGESWRDWGELLPVMLTMPTLALALFGLWLGMTQPEDRDLVFFVWLALMGGSTVFLVAHNEARYLLPTVPAILYFAVRGAETLVGLFRQRAESMSPVLRAVCLASGLGVLAATLAGGAHQAWLDRDPVFFSDLERRASARLLEHRRGDGHLLWCGNWYTIAPREPVMMREDDFFNIFHFAPPVATYFIDEPVDLLLGPYATPEELALSPRVRDGDAILRGADELFATRTIPAEGVPPIEIWSVRQLVLVPDGKDGVVTTPDGTATVRLGVTGDARTVRSEQPLGSWIMAAQLPDGDAPRQLGWVTLPAGVDVPIPLRADDEVRSLLLYRFEREVIS